MKIAAIDSSGLVASVAILQDDIILAQYSVNYKKTHSQTLLPMLAELVKMTEFDLAGLDAIAISKGPGSFTGLRIGSATAKGLAQALDKPIVEVPTLDALAFQLYDSKAIICPMMDARRSQVYTGVYAFGQEREFQTLLSQRAISVDEIIEYVNTLDAPVVFLGDGMPVYKEQIEEKVTIPYYFAPAHLNRQNASALAVLAADMFKKGEYVTAKEHKPEYLRLSQAERERMEKQGQKEES